MEKKKRGIGRLFNEENLLSLLAALIIVGLIFWRA